MTFIKKNLITILILIATLVLAGVAVFTALRLYQLRDEAVAPSAPESEPDAAGVPIEVTPVSGNWNYPGEFSVTNTSGQTITLLWALDCWDESVCSDSQQTVQFAPGDTLVLGLGQVCSKWQLDLNWTGQSGWDYGAVAEVSKECGQTSTPSSTPTSTPSETPSSTPTSTPIGTPDISTLSCTELAFTLGTGTPTPSSTPISTPTGTPTSTPSETPSSAPTSTPTNTPTSTSTATPFNGSADGASTSQAELPAAGVNTPTILGFGAGVVLLLGALLLAL